MHFANFLRRQPPDVECLAVAVVPRTHSALGPEVSTLSRSMPGPDSAFSLEPHEFKAMVEAVRTVEKALGTVHYGVSGREAESRVFRRSLFIVQDVRAGEPFTARNVRSLRPGHGLHPRHLDEVIGRCASQDLQRGAPLQWSHLAGR